MNPNLDDYVHAFKRATDYIDRTVMHQRAPLRESTMFGPAGKTVIHSKGERIIYGPSGEMIARVTEDEAHVTQIEEDERLHGIARPESIRVRVPVFRAVPTLSQRARPTAIRTTVIPKGTR